jgi:hypothetical protein
VVHPDIEFILYLYEVFRLDHPWHETGLTLVSHLWLKILVLVSPSHRFVEAIIERQ